MKDTITETRIEAAIADLTLEEKVRLLTGRDFWSTWPIERIGLRSMVVSDGPAGVRGDVWDERSPSVNLPSASALSASWDVGLARRYGAVAATEARRKGVDIVLGPTINLHRSPRGGRHFEAFSEDPVLTSALAAAYVTGLQDNGVGATPKHYVANDSETERFTVDVRVHERSLRELYLLAFERAVVEARAWLVMSSYNAVNGTTMTENDLLETPLQDEWGFDGVVVSDWSAVRSLTSAEAAQDLAMPGPDGAWGDALVAAVRGGRIDEAVIDRKVRRILVLASRVGAFGDDGPPPLMHVEHGAAFAHEAAVEGMVLLENRGELPWNAADLRSVAVIGNNAEFARTQGGGSATVVPERVVSPLAGLRAALPDADIRYAVGAVTQAGLAGVRRAQMTNPVTGDPGARVSFRDAKGVEFFVEDRSGTEFVWFGGSSPTARAHDVEVAFTFRPDRTERIEFGFALTGHGRLWVDDELALDADVTPDSADPGAAFLTPGFRTTVVDVVAGESRDVRFVHDNPDTDGVLASALSVTIGTRPVEGDAEELIADAVGAARAADVALVIVGTNAQVESEGFDRESLALPGHQDALVRAVAAANPRTVVIVNAGSPVLLRWRDEVAAVLLGWFGGQEFGAAIADVLLGVVEPGGRLPTTWPATEEDVPVIETTPTDGVLAYDEGIHIGYRAWLRAGRAPAYWFGHGLGYASIAVTGVRGRDSASAGATVTLEVTLENTSDRLGKQVVLVFAERAGSAVERPVRWLVGFAAARVEGGATATVPVDVPTRLLAYWEDGWHYESGAYTLRVGTAVDALPLETGLTLNGIA
jgi:beta-glucosidase